LDGSHAGAPLGKLDSGAGVDNIEWSADKRLLYVGAAKSGKLVVMHADEHGQLSTTTSIATSEGARNAVVDAKGNVYLADGPHAQLVVVSQLAQ
jgi:sugar lactone lactonase YvrE